MKRYVRGIAIILCLTLFAAMAMGSGESESGETKQVVTDESKEDGEGDAEDAPGGDDQTAAGDEEEPSDHADVEVTIDEQVLLEYDGIVVTATEYVTDDIWGDGMKLLIENNSDKDVSLSCNATIVNDYMITDLFYSDIAAGKKANETLYLSSSELEAAGIENIGKIELYFHISDTNSYDTIYDSECITVQTSAYADMDTTTDTSGTELYNQDGIRIVGMTVDENSFWGTTILLFVENNSGKNINVEVTDMSVNGFMVEPWYYASVYDGKKSIDSLDLFSGDLEENEIESIEEVELKFHIYNSDTYDTITETDMITFSAE